MFKAADLGREEWQSKVKDDEIAWANQVLAEHRVDGLVERSFGLWRHRAPF